MNQMDESLSVQSRHNNIPMMQMIINVIVIIFLHWLISFILNIILKRHPQFAITSLLSHTFLAHFVIYTVLSVFFSVIGLYFLNLIYLKVNFPETKFEKILITLILVHFMVFFLVIYLYIQNIKWILGLFLNITPLSQDTENIFNEDTSDSLIQNESGDKKFKALSCHNDDDSDISSEYDKEENDDVMNTNEQNQQKFIYLEDISFPLHANTSRIKRMHGKTLNIVLFYPVINALVCSVFVLYVYTSWKYIMED